MTELKLTDHLFGEVGEVPIVDACPKLTHFTCDPSKIIPFGDNDELTQITYLSMENTYFYKDRVERILKRCPNLQCFNSKAALGLAARVAARHFVDLDLILTWCPKLTSFGTTSDLYRTDTDPTLYIRNKPGLCYFQTVDRYGVDKIVRCLKNNRSTLEYLYLRQNETDHDWYSLLKTVDLPSLRTFSLHIKVDAQSLVALMNHFHTVQKWFFSRRNNPIIFDTSIIQSLHTSNTVAHLHLEQVTFNDDLCLSLLLDRLPALQTLNLFQCKIPSQVPESFQCPQQLKNLRLHEIKWKHNVRHKAEKELAVAQFMKGFIHSQSTLEDLHLRNIPKIGKHLLLTIGMMRTLKYLELDVSSMHLRDQDIVGFFKMLQKTEIVELTICNVIPQCGSGYKEVTAEPLYNNPSNGIQLFEGTDMKSSYWKKQNDTRQKVYRRASDLRRYVADE